MEAGASALAFITFALATAKNTHNTLDAVRDGPRNVKETADAVLKLVNMIDRIAKSPAALSDQCLQNDARRGIEELRIFGDKLMELQATPGELAHGKLWKRLQCFLNEKELDSMKTTIMLHYDRLNIRLSSFTSTTALQIREDLVKVRQSFAQTHTTVEAIEQRLASIEGTMQARDSASISAPEAAVMRDMLSAIMESLHINVVDNRSRGSGVIGEVDDEGNSIRPNKAPESNDTCPPRIRESLEASLGRLKCLVTEKERTYQTFENSEQDCSSIIEDLASVLAAAGQEMEALCSDSSICASCTASIKSIDIKLKGFNKRFATDTLVVNGNEPKRSRRAQRIAASASSMNESQLSTIELESGSLTFWQRSTAWECSCGRTDCDICITRGNVERSELEPAIVTEHRTTVTFVGNNRAQPIMLNATNVIRRLQNDYSRSISHLAVNCIRRPGSLVFELVQQGRLQELRECLQRGEFTLRDHDEWGSSLLCYSTQQPEVCKFLLEEKLDVDHVGVKRYDDDMMFRVLVERCEVLRCLTTDNNRSPINWEWNDDEMSATEWRAVRECRLLMLDAGADPLLDVDSESESLLRALTGGGLEDDFLVMSRRAISNGGATLDAILNDRGRRWGDSMLHSCCFNSAQGARASNITAIMKLGFDVNGTDKAGETSLHTLLRKIGYDAGHQPWYIREQEALATLLELGADPNVPMGSCGLTAFDFAYFRCARLADCWFPIEQDGRGRDIGSYRGDLWDSCLSLHGYKTEELFKVRRKYQRRARYAGVYTRDVFESLWKGREHLCPYWDDEPWPPLQPRDAGDEEENETYNGDGLCHRC